MPGGKLPEVFIPVNEAATLLGCGTDSIETGLRNGTFPIGWAWYTGDEGKAGQWNYRIPRAAFYRALETGRLIVDSEAPGKMPECRLYQIWTDIKQRCNNRNHKKYIHFGGKGLGYAFEWEQYDEFERWAYENGYREYMVLERLNEELGYYPENCRWAVYQEKINARAGHLFTIGDETMTIAQRAEKWDVPRSTAKNKLIKITAEQNSRGSGESA